MATQEKQKISGYKVEILKADNHSVFDAKSLYDNIALADLSTITADQIVLSRPHRCSMQIGTTNVKYDRVYVAHLIGGELYPLIFKVRSCTDSEGFRPNKQNPDKVVCNIKLSRAAEPNQAEQETIDHLQRVTNIIMEKLAGLCKDVKDGKFQFVLDNHEAKMRNATFHRTRIDPDTQRATNQYPTLWVDCKSNPKSDGFSTTLHDAATDKILDLKSVIEKPCGGEFAVCIENIYVNTLTLSIKGVLYEAILNVAQSASHKRLLGFD